MSGKQQTGMDGKGGSCGLISDTTAAFPCKAWRKPKQMSIRLVSSSSKVLSHLQNNYIWSVSTSAAAHPQGLQPALQSSWQFW